MLKMFDPIVRAREWHLRGFNLGFLSVVTKEFGGGSIVSERSHFS